MSRRRATYSRVRDVLLSDNTGATEGSIRYIERAILTLLSEYMDIDDVHITFTRNDHLGYDIRIDGSATSLHLPHIC